MSRQINQIYEFGEFRLDTRERLLLRQGQPISLTHKTFETLLALVQNSGHVIEKDELLKEVWPDTVVEEANLTRNIWILRKALDGNNGEHRYIETVPKVGYRFVAPVTELPPEPASLVIQRRVRAHIVKEEFEVPDTVPLTQTVPLLSGQERKIGHWIALMALGAIGLITTITAIWLWRHRNPPLRICPGARLVAR